ncbi:MAG TPA: regulatory iron-sulfur-containing complex subunit RicT [Phycisphaerales bacterium]|nr:regulatory iron-sulfur-containing complex subunit RicT [Phycisphaerales bacterium]
MPILPLPQFETDLKEHLAEEEKRAYEALRAPKTVVVRFGSMKLIGEFQLVQPQNGPAIKPGCGSKLVVRTFRGTEMGEMLTSTCPNSGCSKAVSRHDMLQYIENSGGGDYPFFTEGRVLRVATKQDMEAQEEIEQRKHELRLQARHLCETLIAQGGHDALTRIKVVEVEPVLGGESVTVYFTSEERLELRDFARELQRLFHTRVELRGVGARDEARLTADYEKCGQYCCCKNFLKVLKPVSMKSAKVQKATLDPLKISGRCGRLMCCLRYEDSTYEDLAKNLPRKKTRVGTPDGDGIVLDTQILTQLALVLLDTPGDDGKERQVAVPVEALTPVKDAKGPQAPIGERLRGAGPPSAGPGAPRGPRPERPRPTASAPDAPVEPRSESMGAMPEQAEPPQQRPPQGQQRGAPQAPRQGQAREGGRPQPPRGPQPQRGPRPNQPPPRGPQQRPPQAREPKSRDDEIDDIMGSWGDDLGGGGSPRPPQGQRPPRGPRNDRPRRDGPRPQEGPGGGQGS